MRLFIIVILTLQLTPSWSQLYFNKTYNRIEWLSDVSFQVERSTDNSGYIVPSYYTDSLIGRYYGFRKIDLQGNETDYSTVYQRSSPWISGIYAWNFQALESGGYLYAGMIDSACIMRFDENLELQWRTTVGDSDASLMGAVELLNGDFLTVWRTFENPVEGLELYWISPSGDIVQQQHFEGIGNGFHFVTKMHVLSNGDVLLTMQAENLISFDNLYARINSETGDVIWQKRYGFNSILKQMSDPHSLLLDDSTAAIFYSTRDTMLNGDPYGSSYGSIYAGKLNLFTGDTSEIKLIFRPVQDQLLLDAELTPDGGIIGLCRAAEVDANTYFAKYWLYKLNSEFELEWRKLHTPLPLAYMPNVYSECWDVDVCSDSGYVVSGWCEDQASPPMYFDGKQVPWVFKTDACGDLEWNNCGVAGVPSENPFETFSLSLFPNPANGAVQLKAASVMKEVQLIDLSGRTVLRAQPNASAFEFHLEGIASGVYLVRAHLGDGRYAAVQCVVE